jgi:hypothetical protein
MTYTFVRLKVHPKLDLTDWYLAIPASAFDLTMAMHKSVAASMFNRFFLNPHVFDQTTAEPKYEGYEAYHPLKLAAGWLTTAFKGLGKFGVIYMNSAHGLWFGENVEIVETMESEKLAFPKSSIHDAMKITISKWALAEHYYLSASNNQVFSHPKFNTYEEAITEARKFAHDENITFFDGGKVFQREGD